MKRSPEFIYIAFVLLVAIAAGVTTRFMAWSFDALGCAQHRAPGTFMAYCGSTQYGDYEHGGFYFGLESEAIANLKRAKVLFLGSSLTQVAFSTDEVNSYFRARHVPYYVMGFGYDERFDFALALIEKYQLKPDAIVINADPFFRGNTTRFAGELLTKTTDIPTAIGQILALTNSLEKKLFSLIRWQICRFRSLCNLKHLAIYRDNTNGAWIWRDLYTSDEYGHLAVDLARRQVEELPKPEDLVKARRLIEVTRVLPGCVILTAIPNSIIDAEAFVTDLASALDAKVMLPQIDDLYTWDHSHFTWSSAQRWSARFLGEAESTLQRCTKIR
ncbi:hypothetical protein JQ609_32505 [Bradyrhizobium sp. AUGA SZCCT0169]|uniref:hypothetical protein n=1 Tax=unclassified Bradyrhizobium TaxID=2631580 RepID=UPI001BAB5BC6|nr:MULTISPECIES: hypothetical protein [unclassified Bradyrhizobium]MBR1194074.1 hypothetical protein [Bradyrhizobium sp. AUGA SZCCT0160]MBR1251624.1 hypothetical protein [Bradyrhizobium sp. AUGA SZCCT0169]